MTRPPALSSLWMSTGRQRPLSETGQELWIEGSKGMSLEWAAMDTRRPSVDDSWGEVVPAGR